MANHNVVLIFRQTGLNYMLFGCTFEVVGIKLKAKDEAYNFIFLLRPKITMNNRFCRLFFLSFYRLCVNEFGIGFVKK